MNTYLKYFNIVNYNNKKRFGVNQDGGYVIGLLKNGYDCYVSAGISDEESFSRDFINYFSMKKENCYAFDGTINDYPYTYTSEIQFIKKNIGPKSDTNNVNLFPLINYHND